MGPFSFPRGRAAPAKKPPRAAPPARPSPERRSFRAEDLEHRIETLFRSDRYVPPTLPSATTRVLDLASQQDADLREVKAALEEDPVLVAAVLRLVRSPVYGGADVRSMKDALVRLGLGRVRDLVLEVSLKSRVFKAPTYQATLEEVQRHSRAVAHLCRPVCRKLRRRSDSVFLCGLLHDVGLMAILMAVDAQTEFVPPQLSELIPACRRFHAGCSAQLAHAWNLPPSVAKILAVHHHLQVDGEVNQGAAIVAVAEALAFQLDCGVSVGLDPVDKGEVMLAISALGLSGADLDDLAEQGRRIVERL
jgi:putative nucleotidyltransferase with HDIG domain